MGSGRLIPGPRSCSGQRSWFSAHLQHPGPVPAPAAPGAATGNFPGSAGQNRPENRAQLLEAPRSWEGSTTTVAERRNWASENAPRGATDRCQRCGSAGVGSAGSRWSGSCLRPCRCRLPAEGRSPGCASAQLPAQSHCKAWMTLTLLQKQSPALGGCSGSSFPALHLSLPTITSFPFKLEVSAGDLGEMLSSGSF